MSRLQLVFACASMFAASLLAGCGKSERFSTQAAILNYTSLRQEVVSRVKSGSLPVDKTGAAQLPDDLQPASSDGQVLVSLDNGQLFVAFGVTIGKERHREYILYTEQTLPDSTPSVNVGPLTIAVGPRINSHWYQASSDFQ